MRQVSRAIPALLLFALAACSRDPVASERSSRDGVSPPTTDAPPPAAATGPYTDDLVVVDPAQLELVSSEADLAAGTYRYRVVGGDVPEVVPGTVLYGGGDREYLRRVRTAVRTGDALVAHTTSAFPHEVIRGGRHALRDGSGDGLPGMQAEFFTIVDTFDVALDVCALMADSVGVQVCNKDRTVINKGWVEVVGRVDTLRILSGRVIVEGALDGSYVVDAGGAIVPGTGEPPIFTPCDQYPDATGCFAKVGTALRNFLLSVGVDPNVLPPFRACIPGTPITIVPLRLFPYRPPTIRICRIADWGALPSYTLPGLTSVTLGFVPKVTVSDLLLRALGSATLKLSIPVPKLSVIKCYDHGNGFLCLKAGAIIVLNAGFVEAGGTARLDGLQQSRVELQWTAADGWRSPVTESLESDRSFGFEPEGADTITVRIGPAGVLEATLCFGPNSKTSCVDETSGTDEKSSAGFLLDLNIGAKGKLQVGTYLEGTWSRDAEYDNWHMPVDLLSELEVEFALMLPKILIKPDKNLKTSIPPLQWGRTTMGSYHGTGLLQVSAATTDPPAGLADYTVSVERRDTFPVLQPAGTDRLGLASWEYPLSGSLAPNGSLTFDEGKHCGVAYSDALVGLAGGTVTAALLKGARRLGFAVPNYQVETQCALLIADYVVSLEGVPDQCSVVDGAVRDVRLTQWNRIAGTSRTTELAFEVDCSVANGPPGDLAVTVASTGSDLPAGYRLRLDGGTPVATAANDLITFAGVASRAGRLVRLDDVPARCAVAGDNPRTVEVLAGETVSVRFDVSCSEGAGDAPPAPGSVIVRTVSPGGNPPGGLAVAIDGGTPVDLAEGTDVRFEPVAAGQHVVSLTGLRADCRLTGAPARTVVLPSAGELLVIFEVECSGGEPGEATGGLQITVESNGWPLDPDGYLVRVGSFQAEVATSDTLTVDQLVPGGTEVWLDGVAGNCQVQGAHPRPVTVEAGTLRDITLNVTCQPHAALWFSATTTGEDRDPDGYVVVVNGTISRPIPSNGSVAVTGLVPGTVGVALDGIAPNCTAAGSYPETVELVAGTTETMYVDVTCVAHDRLGEIEVVLRTREGGLPATPFPVLIDGRERGSVVPGQPTVIGSVLAGERALEITGLPAGWRVANSPLAVRIQGRLRSRVVVDVIPDK